ncbi:MAG TPA: mechanosensitive ion channel [Woeseiaceae bacterium]|nr:mechanosensitive ion channel [Woeseiaceae bacterium]
MAVINSTGRTALPLRVPGVRLAALFVFGGALLLIGSSVQAQAVNEFATMTISAADVEARMDAIRASSTVNETSKAALLDQYSQVKDILARAARSRESAEEYRQALENAADEAERIRRLIAARVPDPLVELAVNAESATAAIESELQNARSDEITLALTLRQLDGSINEQDSRRQAVLSRQTEIRDRLARLTNTFVDSTVAPMPATSSEALAWSQIAEVGALQAENEQLQLELRSAPMRLLLLEARRDQASIDLTQTRSRIEAMTNWLAEKRRVETARVIAETDPALLGDARSHPLVKQMLAVNQQLADALAEETRSLNKIVAENAAAATRLLQVQQRLNNMRQQVESGSLSQALGRYLAEERRTLVKLSTYPSDAKHRAAALAESGLRGIRLDQYRRDLLDPDTYVSDLLSEQSSDEIEGLKPALLLLAQNRRELIRQSIDVNHHYRRTLSELEYRESQRHALLAEFSTLLTEKLLWVRSNSMVGFADLGELPAEVRSLFDPALWLDALSGFTWEITHSPMQWVSLLLLAAFLWQQRSLRSRLRASSSRVGKPSEDRIRDTLIALIITLALTVPWALFAWVTGFQMSNGIDSTAAARAVGTSLQRLAPLLFFILFFRELCVSQGVAEGHLRLKPAALKRLRWHFGSLLVTFALPAFLVVVHLESAVAGPESIFNRLVFLLMLGSLAIFLYQLLEPAGGVAYALQRKNPQRFVRWGWYWLSAALAIPASLALMVIIGYTYSAGLLLEKLLSTLWLLFGLVLLREFVVRWLLIARRRLLLRRALNRRSANREASKTDDTGSSADETVATIEEPIVDIAALDVGTRKLVNTLVIVTGLVALTSIWSPVLAAFSFLSEVVLWETQRIIDGQQLASAVTVADVFKALMVIVVTVVAVRHVPSLVEIVLRQRPSLTHGSRLAFAALARYTVAVFGVAVFISMLGVDWSKVQWLVAALGVGIGFGLQEIVANFISGLVILMERPIRVGDVVTVGEAGGTVSEIRIRATTIRTWDRQELLVPNKEFITGRVLNWTLSDEVIRIFFKLGIVYGSDVELALKLLKQVAVSHPNSLDDPAPRATIEAFGENAIILGLRCCVASFSERLDTTTDLHRAIYDEYRRAGISIAIPQRDVLLGTVEPLEVRISRNPDKAK